ncbi:MAG: GvpL/GvpF family gas vesicle protein [Gemmataceae bacterium]|nr:GvpL/GvpF family gas vesicle protein [Gemmataceae bacterium]
MNLLAYAIVRDAEPFRGPLPPGVDGDPLHLVTAGGLAFACGPSPAGEPDTERLLAFARTLQTLHRLGTILPLRFGAVGTGDTLKAKLAARGDEFLADLAKLDGCEEFTLRVPLPETPEPPSPAPTSGTAYLLNRRQKYTQADDRKALTERLVARCREHFAGRFVSLVAERSTADSEPAVAVHFLVRRGAGEDLRAAVAGADWLPTGARLLGPWPAAHFLTPPTSLLLDAPPG